MARKPNIDQQERFCREYLKDLNAKQAAIRAGYSEKTAEVQGSRLLSQDKIKIRIQELMDQRSARTEIEADDILKELKKIGFVDISKAYDDKGDLLLIHEMPEDVRKAIAGIEVFTEVQYGAETNQDGDKVKEILGKTKKLKLSDKLRALELLGKHLKMFTDKVEHSGEVKFDSVSDEELDKRINDLLGKSKK